MGAIDLFLACDRLPLQLGPPTWRLLMHARFARRAAVCSLIDALNHIDWPLPIASWLFRHRLAALRAWQVDHSALRELEAALTLQPR